MKKSLLSLALALASMLAVNAYAQKAAPGEDRAVPAASATKEEKAAAKDARKTEGAKAAKSGAESDKPSTTASKKTTKAEKDAAKAKRKTEGAEAAKAPKKGEAQ